MKVEALVDGGNASGGPPLGPALGPTGVNINQVVSAINEKTKDMAGMKIPVKVIIDPSTKEFEIEVGSPPTSALIKKELNLEKGTGDNNPVGNLSFDQLLKITKMKRDSLLAEDLKGAVKEVIGVCQSVGVTIEGKPTKEITAEIDEGKWDDGIAGQPVQEADKPTEEPAEEAEPANSKPEQKAEKPAQETAPAAEEKKEVGEEKPAEEPTEEKPEEEPEGEKAE